MSTVGMSEDTYYELLIKQAEESLEIIPFKFQKLFYCTREFDTWWKDYQTEKFVDVMTKTHHLTKAFISLQTGFKKGTTTHIKEI